MYLLHGLALILGLQLAFGGQRVNIAQKCKEKEIIFNVKLHVGRMKLFVFSQKIFEYLQESREDRTETKISGYKESCKHFSFSLTLHSPKKRITLP